MKKSLLINALTLGMVAGTASGSNRLSSIGGNVDAYAQGEVIYGKGTQVRYSVIPAGGANVRPAAGTFKVLTGVTTSEIKGSEDTKETPEDYDSPVGAAWKDSNPGSRAWGFTLSANKKADTPQAAMFTELWDAWGAGQTVWVERLLPNSTNWKGGGSWISGPTEPSPADGVVTFSCSFNGKGALIRTAVS